MLCKKKITVNRVASNNSHLSSPSSYHSPVGQRPGWHPRGLTLTPAVGWAGLARGAVRGKAVRTHLGVSRVQVLAAVV